MLHRRDHLFVYVDRLHCRPPLSTCIDSNVMGRSVDLDDLIDVGEVAALLGLAHKNSVTTYLRRYADFPAPALEFAEGKCRAWVREDVERWHERREKNH